MNIFIITGASSGIGREFALQLDNAFPKIDEIWLIARSRDKLEETARVMQHKTRLLPMDITDKCSMRELQDTLKKENAVIRMLINCAGYGLMGSFQEISSEEQSGMIRLNCEALTNMTHLCIPFMKKNSRIIQMASSAAFVPQPYFNVYAASKAYVLSFSKALAEELRPQGIYVTAVCPGPVDTEFFDVAEKYENTLTVKKFTMIPASKAVQDALRASYYRRATSVSSLPIKAFEVCAKVVPHNVLMQVMNTVKSMEEKDTRQKGQDA